MSSPEATIVISRYKSPAGVLLLGDYNGCLCLCDWLDSPRHQTNIRRLCRRLNTSVGSGSSATIVAAAARLDRFFAGQPTDTLPLLLAGTDFQLQVWNALLTVSRGTTVSYSNLAAMLQMPRAVRAVATAVACNPLSIFIPCHRVIGADGSLGGYAGGSAAKLMLLDLELYPHQQLQLQAHTPLHL